MFRRFHHGHSAGLGFLLALALAPHTLWLVTVAMIVGVIVGRAWATWTLWASALRGKWHLSKRERIASGIVPVYGSRKGRDDIPF